MNPLKCCSVFVAGVFLFGVSAVWAAPAVELTITKAPGDHRGTNVKNIFVLTAKSKGKPSPDKYIVMFYVDDVFEYGVRDQVLPVSATRNLRGHGTGLHQVRVDLEDNSNNGVVLATTSAPVTVTVQ